MNKEQIREEAKKTTGLFSYRNGYSTAEDAFIAGAQWANNSILQEVLYWLEDTTIDDADGCGHPIVSFIGFDCKEQMLQSFEERFNISNNCDQQYPSDFINDR